MEFIIANWYLFAGLLVVLYLLYGSAITQKLMGINAVSAFEAVRLMNQEKAVLIDVCEDNEYKEGHILNSVNMPLSGLSKRMGEMDKHKAKPVIISCRTGNRSGRAASMLRKNGFESVHILTGGMTAWKKENLPVEK
ncbi:MAG: rhodanese-like domain-containing protein [Acidiferrobacterales bacterium]